MSIGPGADFSSEFTESVSLYLTEVARSRIFCSGLVHFTSIESAYLTVNDKLIGAKRLNVALYQGTLKTP